VFQWLALVVIMIRGKLRLWPFVLAVIVPVLFMASPAEAG